MDPDAVLRYEAGLSDAMVRTMGFMLITYVPLQVAAVVMMKRLLWRIAAALPLIPMLPVIYVGFNLDTYRDGSLYGLAFYFPYAPAMVYLAAILGVGIFVTRGKRKAAADTTTETTGTTPRRNRALITVAALGVVAGIGLLLFVLMPARSNDGPSSPREALIRYAEVLHDGDESRLFAALQATEAQKDFMRANMQFLTAKNAFRDAFTTAYGQQAWDDFQDDSKGPKDGNAKITTTDSDEIVARWRNATIDERGHEALCKDSAGAEKAVRLIKVDGAWRVDASSVCPRTQQMRKMIEEIKPVTVLLRKYEKAIGREGIKPEDIDAELGRAIMKVLKGVETPAPHRFDIDRL
ncbi:MAG: hypothetical protein H8E44_24110 [Planctomycetes bacterium]|nr:hypothetical protein [Planctomycetota bacterium]MBL7042436.1 hypothetical protein [Pirellulaceae bacterium]